MEVVRHGYFVHRRHFRGFGLTRGDAFLPGHERGQGEGARERKTTRQRPELPRASAKTLQVGHERSNALMASLRAWLEPTVENAGQCPRARNRRGGACQLELSKLRIRGRAKWRSAGERFEEGRAQRVLVGERSRRGRLHLLGGHIEGRSEDCSGLGQPRVDPRRPFPGPIRRYDWLGLAKRSRQTEIGEHDSTRAFDEKVRRFDVAVHELGIVDGGQPLASRDEHVQHDAPCRSRPLAMEIQRLAVDQLHREIDVVTRLPGVEDGNDVVVPNSCDRLSFAKQSRPLRFAPVRVRAEDLDRDAAVENRVERGMDRPHLPLSEQPDELVATDRTDGARFGRVVGKKRCHFLETGRATIDVLLDAAGMGGVQSAARELDQHVGIRAGGVIAGGRHGHE